MEAHRKDRLCDESLEVIRQELSHFNLSDITDEEYINLLTRHTSGLIDLLDRLNGEEYSEENLGSILDLLFGKISEPLCAIDSQTRLIYFNDCWKYYFKQAGTMHNLDVIIPAEYRAIFLEAIKKDQLEDKRIIFPIISKTGRTFMNVLPFSNAAGKHNYIISFIGDDMHRQLNMNSYSNTDEEAATLFAGEEQIPYELQDIQRTIAEMIDGFYFVLTNQNLIRYISSSVTGKLGYSPEELIGKPIDFITNSENHGSIEGYHKLLMSSVSSSVVPYKIEVELIGNNRVINTYEIKLSRYNSGTEWIAICTDIESHKVREHDLLVAKNTAELNDKLKSDYLANMSHEIRTPLNGIIGFSTMLGQADLLDEKREKYLRIIHSSTSHLLTLVSDIIDISKIEAGQLKILYNKVDLHQLFDDIQATFIGEAKRLNKKNIRLIKQVEKLSEGMYFKSDEVRLKQVMNNLLGNALKFTDTGDIRFGYSAGSETIRFFVQDSGNGISKSAQETIFNRFKQTEEGEKDKYKGTGLGLAISKGIIDLMGGKIGVHSEPGKGSEFYFILPLTLCE